MSCANMKLFVNLSWRARIVVLATFTLVIIGLLLRKPLLITYHRKEMIDTWQIHVGLPRQSSKLDLALQYVGIVPTTKKPFANANAMSEVFQHRAALVRLHYFSQRRFVLPPMSVASQEYRQLCDQVAAQTGQQPTAQFDYDVPNSPSRVLGLTVYATAEDMIRWERFVAAIAQHNQ